MPQYVLNMVQPVGVVPPPEVLEPVLRELAALNEEMKAAGAWVFAAALHQPETSTVVRADGDDVLVTDGPYAEGKEMLGGICLVKAPDLDAALEWGRKAALATTLPIEVRPFMGDAD